jgi:dUTP pyrophosphatase
MHIKIQKLTANGTIPTKTYCSDAGWDLYAASDYNDLEAGVVRQIDTDIAISVPVGYVGLILDRSGMGRRGFKVHGGVIDPGYTGNVGVLLIPHKNLWDQLRDWWKGAKKPSIKKGDRIAQLCFIKTECISWCETDKLDDSVRNTKGFGSSDGSQQKVYTCASST